MLTFEKKKKHYRTKVSIKNPHWLAFIMEKQTENRYAILIKRGKFFPYVYICVRKLSFVWKQIFSM